MKNKLLKSTLIGCVICTLFSIFYVGLYLVAKLDSESSESFNLTLVSMSLCVPFTATMYLAYMIKAEIIKSAIFAISSYLSLAIFVAMSCLVWGIDFYEFDRDSEISLIYVMLIVPLTIILYVSYLSFESYCSLRSQTHIWRNVLGQIFTYIGIILLALIVFSTFVYIFGGLSLTNTILFVLFFICIYGCVCLLGNLIDKNFIARIKALILFIIVQFICLIVFSLFFGL